MRKAAFSILILIIMLFAQAGCMPEITPTAVEKAPDEQKTLPVMETAVSEAQPLSLPSTGKPTSLLVAAALTIEEHRSTGTFSIVPVSAESGEPLEGFEPLVLGGAIAYGFSKDRSQMAFLSNRSEGCLTYCLRVMDLLNWKEMVQPIPVEKSLSAWFTIPTFDEDSRIIPVILNKQSDTLSEVLLVDRSAGKVAARTSIQASLFQAAETPAGNLAVHGLQTSRSGAEPLLYLALLDGKTLNIVWEQTLSEIKLFVGGEVDHSEPMQGQYYDPARVFSADGSKLYLVAADQPLLATVDFQNQTVQTVRIQPKLSWWQHLLANTVSVAHAKTMNGISKSAVLSADGRFLYVVGQETKAVKNERGEYDLEFLPLGLQVIDTQNGSIVKQGETEASRLALAQDGKTLLLHGWRRVKGGNEHPWTDVMDIAAWKVTQRLEGTANPSRLLDGSPAWLVVGQYLGSKSSIDLYRPGDSAPRSQITRFGYVDWVLIP